MLFFCQYFVVTIYLSQQLNNYIKFFITINNYMSCPTIKCMSIIIALHISWGSDYKLLENFQQHFQLLPWKHASNYPDYSPTTYMYFYQAEEKEKKISSNTLLSHRLNNASMFYITQSSHSNINESTWAQSSDILLKLINNSISINLMKQKFLISHIVSIHGL